MPLARLRKKQYLCSVKRIEYILPIDAMHGNISGRQTLLYNGAAAYDIGVGDSVAANNYQPRIIVKVRDQHGRYERKFFQVRTRNTVNMTSAYRLAVSALGGAGALFGSLVRNKGQIYNDCLALCPKGYTLRQIVFPLLAAGLRTKAANIVIGDGVAIVNPWVSAETPNVPVGQAVLDKFAGELSNS